MRVPAGRLLMLALAALLAVVTLSSPSAVAQDARPAPLQPPSVAADQTNPGRWEIFASGRGWPGDLVPGSAVGVDRAGNRYIGASRYISRLAPDGTVKPAPLTVG